MFLTFFLSNVLAFTLVEGTAVDVIATRSECELKVFWQDLGIFIYIEDYAGI